MSRMEGTDYRFATGTPFPQSLAGPVSKELLALRKNLDRGPVPADVLAYARANPESAIAKCFDWDSKAAAEAHWLAMAGSLLRAVRVHYVVTPPKGEAVVIETRLMHHVLPIDAGLHDGPVYLPATETLPNFHYRTQLIEGALVEKDRWVNKYGYLHELDVFFRKLAEADEAFGRKVAKKPMKS